MLHVSNFSSLLELDCCKFYVTIKSLVLVANRTDRFPFTKEIWHEFDLLSDFSQHFAENERWLQIHQMKCLPLANINLKKSRYFIQTCQFPPRLLKIRRETKCLRSPDLPVGIWDSWLPHSELQGHTATLSSLNNLEFYGAQQVVLEGSRVLLLLKRILLSNDFLIWLEV